MKHSYAGIKFPAKIPCTGCMGLVEADNAEELDAALNAHAHRFGVIDPGAQQRRYEDGYAKGFAAGFEAGRATQQ